MDDPLEIARRRTDDTGATLLLLALNGLLLHVPDELIPPQYVHKEWIAVYRAPAALRYAEKTARIAVDGALSQDIHPIHSKSFNKVAGLIEANPHKLHPKVEFQHFSVRFLEVKELIKLALSGHPEMVDVFLLFEASNSTLRETSVLFVSEEWNHLISGPFNPLSKLKNFNWMRRTFGFVFGTMKSLKHSKQERFSEENKRRMMALALHRLVNLLQYLEHSDWTMRWKVVSDTTLKLSEFTSSTSVSELLKGAPGFTIVEALKDLLSPGFNEDHFLSWLESACNHIHPVVNESEKAHRKLKTVNEAIEKTQEDIDLWLSKIGTGLDSAPLQELNIIPNVKEPPSEVIDILTQLQFPLSPSQVLFMTRSGSFLYDLSTSSSDVDYFIVFSHKPVVLECAFAPCPELYESHLKSYKADKSGVVEFSASDLDSFCFMLLKGNPRNIEPLFASNDKILYESDLWKVLKANRESLISGRVVAQYQGFVFDRLKEATAELEKKDLVRCSKYLYQALHKLYDLSRLVVENKTPKVTLDGKEKELILEVRESHKRIADTAELLEFLSSKLADAKRTLEELEAKAKEFPRKHEADFDFLFDYLLTVRFAYQELGKKQEKKEG